jgi:hypothetical protein
MNMPKNNLNGLHVGWILVLLTAFMLLRIPVVQPVESVPPEKALDFLQNVIGLDIAKYNVNLMSYYTEYPPELGDLPQAWFNYALESEESKIDVFGQLINNTLTALKITVHKGGPILAEAWPENILDMTKIFMQRYQSCAKASYAQQMLNVLDQVSELKALNVTMGYAKLRISINDPFTHIEWIYTSNGIEFERKRLEFIFQNGYFRFFINYWDVYKIGGDDINVNSDEAVSIAREVLKDIPPLYMRKGNETVKVQPRLGNYTPKVKLITAVREPLTLYPLWHVTLYFDQFYGMYYGVAAEIWADTGEIRTTYPLGFMGAPSQSSNATSPETEIPTWPPQWPPNQPPTETPQEESQNSQPEENPPNQSTDTQPDQNTNTNITPIIAAAITTATIIAAVTTTAIYKRKTKTNFKANTI